MSPQAYLYYASGYFDPNRALIQGCATITLAYIDISYISDLYVVTKDIQDIVELTLLSVGHPYM